MAETRLRSPQAAEHVVVEPMSVNIGAEVRGVDLTRPLGSAEVGRIRQALLNWKVIFFRDQHLNHRQHIDFAKRFGDVTPAHAVFNSDPDYPEIYPITKHRTAFAARPSATRAWTDWHTDVTATVNPPFGSILRGVVVPPYGGDTHFTNTAAAYRALSPSLQQYLSTLRAVHRFKRAGDGGDSETYNQLLDRNPVVAEHPLVARHPETGEACLYTSQEFTSHIVGLHRRESDMLLEFLWEHAIRAEFTVRFRWREGSIAFWDNRATQHQAIRDVYDSDFEREFYRVTLNGTVPVGLDGRPSRRISGDWMAPA